MEPFDILRYKETKILTLEEILSRMDNEFKLFEEWGVTTNLGRDNIRVYRHEITHEIFVLKVFSKEQDFRLIRDLLDCIDNLDPKCKRFFVRAAYTPRAFIMEYWHATVEHFLKYDFLNFSDERWDIERSKIIYSAAKGVECLFVKNFYYTDMKAENVFVRYRNTDPQDELTFVLGDLYAARENDDRYFITYRPPGDLNDYNKESLVVWGLIVLIVQVWSVKPNSIYPFELYRQRDKVIPALKKIMPFEVVVFTDLLYENLRPKLAKEEALKFISKIKSFFAKRIDLYLSNRRGIKSGQ